MHACMHVRMYVSMYISMYVSCIRMYVFIYMYIYTYIYTYLYICIYIYAYVCICIHTQHWTSVRLQTFTLYLETTGGRRFELSLENHVPGVSVTYRFAECKKPRTTSKSAMLVCMHVCVLCVSMCVCVCMYVIRIYVHTTSKPRVLVCHVRMYEFC